MDISVAGMQAASQWLGTTAANIVALTSSSPVPAPQGTVAASIQNPPTFPLAYDPQAPYANMQGMVAAPSGDIANEMVHLREAADSFRANLLAYKVSSRMIDNLLNTLA